MPNRSSTLRLFFVGLAIGGVIGLGQVAWYKFTGQWMKFPHVYAAFWALVGAITGLLLAGVAHYRRKRS